ncbi:translational activator for mitochondrial COX1 [Dispira parvispora]|uniref:Translational activator for mitochondrial COX1 n=1 Tax=Dispira parvispora TaxID=1520584 RepID=A0A9W8E6U3_9FUNG|nr:translational activator for mitochondrial COX1 [Dispira parvispora]
MSQLRLPSVPSRLAARIFGTPKHPLTHTSQRTTPSNFRKLPIIHSTDVARCWFHSTQRAPLLDFIFSSKKKSSKEATSTISQPSTSGASVPLLTADNLFHPLSQSPIPTIREKSVFIAEHGCCPVCVESQPFTDRLIRHMTTSHPNDAQGTVPQQQSPENVLTLNKLQSKPPTFECPECGYPTHCSQEHYEQDKANHDKICQWLRETNQDEHDLRSGRAFKEFEFPSTQPEEDVVNLANWDTLLYTRSFPSLVNPRAIRHVTKLLTYPMTMASVIHPLSPYNLTNLLTAEGLRSLAALRTTLGEHVQLRARKDVILDPLRIFVVGARAEAMLPPHVYLQLAHLFPHSPLHIYFVGPEATPPPSLKERHVGVTPQLLLRWEQKVFHEFFHEATPFDPYRDIFFLFSPGIGYPFARSVWQPSLETMIETKCPIFITSYNRPDMTSDLAAIEEDYKDTFDWIMKPGENVFRSLKKEVNLLDLTETSQANQFIYGIRGKKYEVTLEQEDSEQ